MNHRFTVRAVSTLAVLIGTSLLHATIGPPLPPGVTVIPGTATAPGGLPILVDATTLTAGGLNEGFSWKTSTGGAHPKVGTNGASGNFINAVYVDPVTHKLDFYYQIMNTFSGATSGQNTLIDSFDLTNWAGIHITEVDQLTKATTGNFFGDGHSVEFKGTTADSITTISRSAGNGNDLTVNFASSLQPGQNSSVLLIKTTSTVFDLGSGTFTWVTPPPACTVAATPTNLTPCGVADFGTFGLGALEPVVPEPGFYGLLALGMAAMWIGVHRRSAKKSEEAA